MDHRLFVSALFDARGDAMTALARSEGWGAVHELAQALDAEALLAARLRVWGASGTNDVAPHVLGAITHAYKNNVVHALAAEKELADICSLFARERVDVAPLKGAALMRMRVHRDLGGRYMHDLDLLVRARDRRRIRALLDARGYGQAPEGESPKHLPPLRRGRIYVELHEFAYWEADGARVDLDRWFGGSAAAERGSAAGVMERVVVQLVHHLYRSSVTEPALALKTAWDLHEIAATSPDWTRIEGAAARAGLGPELAITRALSTPDARAADREAALDACRPLREGELARRVLAFHVGALTRAPLWYRALHARAILAPSRRAMEKIEGRPLRGAALAAAYVTRPVRLAMKALRGASS